LAVFGFLEDWMELVREIEMDSPVPRFEIPGWREKYGVVAGITGRGDEPGRGFDLGLWNEAPIGETMSRWRAFRRAEPGFPGVVLATQVHGGSVLTHGRLEGWVQLDGHDGHVTGAPGLLLTVTVADCVPVYLLDPVRGAIGLLHSGWRGTVVEILRVGVEAMVEGYGSSVGDIVMHSGIAICGPCYEVGSEVMVGCGLPADGPGPWHVDLRAVLADQARSLGIRNISTSQWCSSHDRPKFYSHRGSGGRDGRMVAYLGVPRA
jgi:polyphenol oxidase